MHENRFMKAAIALALMFPTLTLAHPGHDLAPTASGFIAGLTHPLTSVEHLLALIALGFLVAKVHRAWLWFAALLFVGISTALIAAAQPGASRDLMAGVATGSLMVMLASAGVTLANLRMIAADRRAASR
jgi:urease accessory protein